MIQGARMSFRRILIVFSVSLFLSGCVYLRLLAFKNQLKDFDLHFTIESETIFALRFLHPVLYAKDLLYLAERQPSEIIAGENGERWLYRFRKVDLREEPSNHERGTDLVFEMTIDRQNLLEAITLSPLFLQIVPPQFIEASLRSLGGGHIDRKNRRISANAAKALDAGFHPPDRNKILSELGEPLSVAAAPDTEILIYSYRYELNLAESKKTPPLANVNLTCDPKTGLLTFVHADFAGMKVTLNYRKMIPDENLTSASSTSD
jgi:hypothetical protein